MFVAYCNTVRIVHLHPFVLIITGMIINNCVSRLWFKAEDPHSGISLLRFNIINLSIGNNSIAENGSIPVNTSTVVSNKQIQIYSPKIIEFSFVCVYFIISFKLLFLPPILTLRT